MKKIVAVICMITILCSWNIEVFAEELINYGNYPVGSEEYLQYYFQKNDIKINKFDSEKKTLQKFEKKLTESGVVNIEEKKTIKKGKYYARTKEKSSIIYAGELKDNKPNGRGIVYKKVTPFSSQEYLAKIYEGNFKDGKFNGYGTEYALPEDSATMYEEVTEDVQQNIFLSLNPITYQGEFKGGKRSGKGVEYEYTLDYNKYVEQGEEAAGEESIEEKIQVVWDQNGYVCNNSDKAIITSSNDYLFLSEERKQIAINEIYARHGRLFNDSKIQQYFDSQFWYSGIIPPEEFDDSALNDIEQTNIKILKGEIYPESVQTVENIEDTGDEISETLPLSIMVMSGTYKNGKQNGKFKAYSGEQLIYDGDIKKGKLTGEAKIYDPETGKLIYEGGLKNGQYHGKGTEYDENGYVKYKGMWENGDFAD